MKSDAGKRTNKLQQQGIECLNIGIYSFSVCICIFYQEIAVCFYSPFCFFSVGEFMMRSFVVYFEICLQKLPLASAFHFISYLEEKTKQLQSYLEYFFGFYILFSALYVAFGVIHFICY